ncbi:MAG: hypothetical protein AAGF79_08225 [Pseudomonadota bacterium]
MSVPIKHLIRQSLIGFAIAAAFVALLLGLNVANLWELVRNSDVGVLALFLLWFFNGIVFASVQLGIFIMSLAEKSDSTGGRGRGIADYVPVRVPAHAGSRARQNDLIRR